MKSKRLNVMLLAIMALLFCANAFAQDPTQIVREADKKMQGESNYSEMDMIIVRPKWERTISFKSWSMTTKNSMTLITAPAKEQGQSFLKRGSEMWSWNPTISRMIKLPASMMSQGWMGSDFTNDELLKESSIVVDYTHKLLGVEKISGKDCYKIELKAKDNAAVVWGKQIKWISKDSYMQLKTEYYDEDEYLVKTEIGSDIKVMDGREIPTRFELIPEEDPGHKTIVVMKAIKFNEKMEDSFFSQQNMKRLR